MAIILGMYDTHSKPPRPPLHDPEREATSRRVQANLKRQRWESMTTAEIVAEMSDAEIAKNARKGGVACIAEQERRRGNA
jgi:hypothetical protein